MFFVDYSSVFNIIIPDTRTIKLDTLPALFKTYSLHFSARGVVGGAKPRPLPCMFSSSDNKGRYVTCPWGGGLVLPVPH